jgi:hypothetical protein
MNTDFARGTVVLLTFFFLFVGTGLGLLVFDKVSSGEILMSTATLLVGTAMLYESMVWLHRRSAQRIPTRH